LKLALNILGSLPCVIAANQPSTWFKTAPVGVNRKTSPPLPAPKGETSTDRMGISTALKLFTLPETTSYADALSCEQADTLASTPETEGELHEWCLQAQRED